MMRRILRLMAGLATLPALLIPFRAQTYHLWMLRVGVTEWGHYSTFVAFATLIRPIRQLLGPQIMALWAGMTAILLSPVLRALPIAQKLPSDLARAFGPSMPLQQPDACARPAPLVWTDLLFGVRLRHHAPERIMYAAHNGQSLAIDLYRGSGSHAAPLVIVIHGGSWQGGDPSQLADLNRYLAARGYAVAALSYRLAPDHPFPAAYDDVLAAIRFLKQCAPSYGFDAQRIVLLGRSAGGHLALLAGYCSDDQAICGVVGLYPPTDLYFGYTHPANPRVLDTTSVLREFLGGSPQEQPQQYHTASPIGFVGPQTPPTLLIHGTTDELVSVLNSRYLAARLAQAQRPHFLLELPWATHGCDANLSGPSGQLSTYAIEHFLAACVQPSVT